VRALPDKQCESDALPTRHLKDRVDQLAPFLVELYNRSLFNVVVPDIFHAAYITPLHKKLVADPDDVKNYRPISNLTVLSKLLEQLAAKQLLDYLTTRLILDLQSAYSLDRDGRTEGPVGHHDVSGERRPRDADIARPLGCTVHHTILLHASTDIWRCVARR